MSAVPSSANTLDFLRQHSPFDRFEAEDLVFLAERLTLVRFDAAATLAAPDLGPPMAMYIVRHGQVQVTEPGDAGSETTHDAEIGDCFPIGALSGRRAPGNTWVATPGAECYRLSAADFHALAGTSAVFSQFCSNYLASLVSQSRRQMQVRFSQEATDQQSLSTRLHQLVKREPFSVPADTPIGTALERMDGLGIGSVVVVDAERRPSGIFTMSDLLHRVVLPRIALDLPIGEVMSPQPVTVPESATAYEAMMAMATRGIRHVLLVDEAGRLTGVVSERDLFALQRVGLGQIRRAIAAAPDIETLRRAAGDVRQFAFNMLAQGVGAEQLTQFISALNDGITCRILELNLRDHDFYGVEWAWLAFGSEGREEQTLSTDQDNGIVYICPDLMDREPLQLRFLEFAQAVNRDLDACGFPLCKGNVMASNPSWCLTLDQWKERFSQWLQVPEPQALLNASIFFDFRPVWGARHLADQMYQHLFSLSRNNSAFQRTLAANALSVAPPLGVFRDFVTESDAEVSGFIDLKKYGSRLFVDAARVLSLAHGVFSANTVTRLRRIAQLQGNADDSEAQIDAFNFIQLLRLRHQHLESEQGRPGDNRIVPDRLNQLDRRILVESFRQAKRLQQKLKLNYQL